MSTTLIRIGIAGDHGRSCAYGVFYPGKDPAGAQIPLGQVADFQIKKGSAAIKSENARRTAWLYVDLRDIDVGSYVKMAKRVVDTTVEFPAWIQYSLERTV